MTEQRYADEQPAAEDRGADEELARGIAGRGRRVAGPERQPTPRHRTRQVAAAVLVPLAAFAIVAATIATWVHSTVLETDRFVGLVGPVLGTPEVDAALGARLTEEVVDALDLEARLETRLSELGTAIGTTLADALELGPVARSRVEALPLPELRDLAAPMASGLEARVAARIDAFVASPEFERSLVRATRIAHAKAAALLRGQHDQVPAVAVEDGEVRLDLVPVVARVLRDLVDEGLGTLGIEAVPILDPLDDPGASIARLAGALGTDLPEDFAQLTVMSESELRELQAAVRLADRAVWATTALAVVLAATAIAVSPRRRRTLVQVGLVTGAVTVVTMALTRRAEEGVASLAVTAEGRAALAVLADATFDPLRTVAVVVLVMSLLVAAVAHLIGRPTWMTGGLDRLPWSEGSSTRR